MSRDQIIDFLWQRWIIVVTFFNEYYPQVVQIIPHFYDIINQFNAITLSQAQQFTITQVTTIRVFLTNYVSAMVTQVQSTLMSMINDTRADLYTQVSQLRAFIIGLTNELRARIEAVYDELRARIQQTEEKILSQFLPKLEQLTGEFKLLYTEFHELVARSGLRDPDNLAFLKVFITRPYDYIEQMVYDSLFHILAYILAYGLTKVERDIEDKPPIGKIKPTKD